MQKYTCALCGKAYDNYEDYARCVAACARKRNEDETAANKKRLEEEKHIRERHIRDLYSEYSEAVKDFFHDYGYVPSQDRDSTSSVLDNALKFFFS